MGSKIEILPGTVFGRWVVLGEDPVKRDGKFCYFVRCECGTETSTPGRILRNGESTQCRKCSNQKISATQNKKAMETGIHSNYVSSLHLNRGKSGRQLQCTITVEDLASLWEEQGGVCALTGWSLILKMAQRDFSATASVDRIDSNGHYTPENVQWLHKDVNNSKQAHTEERFFEICQAVAAHKDQTKKLREGKRPWLKGSSE